MNMSRKTDAAEREKRRLKVAANLKAGLNYRQMAEALDVSLGTVAGDVKILFNRWRKEQVSDIDDHITLQVVQVDTTINAIWDRVTKGELPAIDRMLKLQERKSKLLGLDQPQAIDMTSKGAPLGVSYIMENRNGDSD
jgi:hypothetical protein